MLQTYLPVVVKGFVQVISPSETAWHPSACQATYAHPPSFGQGPRNGRKLRLNLAVIMNIFLLFMVGRGIVKTYENRIRRIFNIINVEFYEIFLTLRFKDNFRSWLVKEQK